MSFFTFIAIYVFVRLPEGKLCIAADHFACNSWSDPFPKFCRGLSVRIEATHQKSKTNLSSTDDCPIMFFLNLVQFSPLNSENEWRSIYNGEQIGSKKMNVIIQNPKKWTGVLSRQWSISSHHF